MIVKLPILAGALLLAAGYTAYPCLTLYRLDTALRSGDSNTLTRLIDWGSVREGLQEDIADDVTDTANPHAVAVGAQLAPFGFSFARSIVGHAVQQEVTPAHVITCLRGQDGSAHTLGLRSAYFTDWSRFIVNVGPKSGQPDIRLQLDLQDGTWRLTRVWLPASMLHEPESSHPVEAVARLPAG